jgi:hypothetical protein
MNNTQAAVREHELKCWPGPYDSIERGEKTCEYRLNDRDFATGDVLHLRRFQPAGQLYTGAEMRRKVTHVLRSGFGLPGGYAILSLESPLTKSQGDEIVRLRAALELICKGAPSEMPERYDGDNHGDTAMSAADIEHFRVAEIARSALSTTEAPKE